MINKNYVTVKIKDLKKVHVAYIRYIGPFKGEVEIWSNLFQKLINWAGARDLVKCPGTQYFTVFRDNLKITEFYKFKTDACISVDKNTQGSGEINISVISAGKYAGAEFEQAWDLIYSEWLPQRG